MRHSAVPYPFRLDRARYYAPEHGSRPDRLRYWQDDLPFDADGRLCAELCSVDDIARADALAAQRVRNPDYQEPLSDDGGVDLERWGRGEVAYAPARVVAAIRCRYGKSVATLAEAIEFLVFEAKLIPEAEASRKLFGRHERVVP